MSANRTDVLIVGAGMAGLMAAGVLQRHGLRVRVVDKGRSVGGRLATRRIGDGRADHGAQFFTVRTPEFQHWIDQWLDEGLVYRWSSGWSNGELVAVDGYPRYAVYDGMNSLAQHLAQPIDVQVNIKLAAVTPTDDGWHARDDTGQTFASRALLLTPPVPQTLELLNTGNTPLEANDRQWLEQVVYAPCLTGLFEVNGPVFLPEPGAIQRVDEPVSWIADNQRKGISPDATVVTVNASPDYSYRLWDIPDAEVLKMLQAALQPFLRSVADIGEAQLKRWRHALPTTLYPRRTFIAADLPPLAFAGDAFGEPRVEGAAMSGLAAGEALAAKLAEAG
jgi:renalase